MNARALLLIVLLGTASAQSPPPTTIDFQARLTDNVGTPLTGLVTITTAIYDADTGGSALWQEVHSTTALSGVVNLRLGSSTAIPVSLVEEGTLYLGLKIGTDPEMTPRRQLASVPFSLRSSRVERVDPSTTIDPNVIARPNIQLDAIDTLRLQDGEVRLSDIAVDAVDSVRICDGSVALPDISPDAVDSGRIVNGGIARPDMSSDSVDSDVICDASVSIADMADDAVDSGVICNGTVALADMGADAVNSVVICDDTISIADMANDAVDTAVICDGSIALADMDADSVDSAVICNGSVGSMDLAPAAVTSSAIATSAVALSNISTAGAASGQVLKYNGASLGWTADVANTFALPFSDTTIDPIGFLVDGIDAAQRAILGRVTGSPGGFDIAGVWGENATDSPGAAGVVGVSTAPFGNQTYGVKGGTAGNDGSAGVYGWTTGEPESHGVLGETSGSQSSAGVRGVATQGYMAVYGVFGESAGDVDSAGVYGRTTNPNQPPNVVGVLGETNGGMDSAGVRGVATGTGFERTYGVTGETNGGEDSVGVRGVAAQVSLDRTYGVTGETNGGNESAGVYGRAKGNQFNTRGVWGHTESDEVPQPIGPSAAGVLGTGSFLGVEGRSDIFGPVFGRLGVVTDTGGNEYRGVEGHAASADRNYGVYAEAGSAGPGPPADQTYGVFGRGLGTNPGEVFGVYGRADAGPGPRYGVFSDGDFGGTGAKFFVQPHPTDPSMEIRYVCLEGPESGTYFRGSAALVNGEAVITVPDSFGMVTEPEGLTVQLTAVGGPATLWVESQDLRTIVVHGKPDVRFHYFANGVRRGYADLEPMQENAAYAPSVRGVPFGTALRPAQRQLLIDNGTLNADFTPNEATAAAMGWTLRDPTPAELAAAGL